MVLSFLDNPERRAVPAFSANSLALLASGIAEFAPNIRCGSGVGNNFLRLDSHACRFDANGNIKAAAELLLKGRNGAKPQGIIAGG